MRNRAPLVRARAESTKALYVLSYSCVVVITIIVCAYVRTAVHSSNHYYTSYFAPIRTAAELQTNGDVVVV